MAAVCLLSSCTTDKTEAVYIVNHGVASHNESKVSPSESATLIDEYIDAVIALDKKCASSFEWRSWVKNGNYSSADADAKTKFASICSEYDAFYKEWEAKFAACKDDLSSFDEVSHLTLKRVSNESKTVDQKTYEIKFNE